MTRKLSTAALGLLLGVSLMAPQGSALELEGEFQDSNVYLELPGLIGPMEIERATSLQGPWTLIENRPIGCTQYCSYQDYEIRPGKVFYYRVWVPHETGEKDLYGPVRVVIPDLSGQTFASLATPNPFYNRTSLRFNLPPLDASVVRIEFIDARGRVLRTFHEDARPGSYAIAWDGRTERGEEVSTGLYFYRISIPGYSESGRIVYLK